MKTNHFIRIFFFCLLWCSCSWVCAQQTSYKLYLGTRYLGTYNTKDAARNAQQKFCDNYARNGGGNPSGSNFQRAIYQQIYKHEMESDHWDITTVAIPKTASPTVPKPDRAREASTASSSDSYAATAFENSLKEHRQTLAVMGNIEAKLKTDAARLENTRLVGADTETAQRAANISSKGESFGHYNRQHFSTADLGGTSLELPEMEDYFNEVQKAATELTKEQQNSARIRLEQEEQTQQLIQMQDEDAALSGCLENINKYLSSNQLSEQEREQATLYKEKIKESVVRDSTGKLTAMQTTNVSKQEALPEEKKLNRAPYTTEEELLNAIDRGEKLTPEEMARVEIIMEEYQKLLEENAKLRQEIDAMQSKEKQEKLPE